MAHFESKKQDSILDSGNMEDKNPSSGSSTNNISKTSFFTTSEDLLSHFILQVSDSKNIAIFLDLDDTIAFKVHPDGSSEQDILQEMSQPDCDIDSALFRMQECRSVISPKMVRILDQIQTNPTGKYHLVIATRRENGADAINQIFEESGLRTPEVIHQVTIGGGDESVEKIVGGKLFRAEPHRTVTIDKGAVIGEWVLRRGDSTTSAMFIDDIELNIDDTKSHLAGLNPELHRNTQYGTVSDGVWVDVTCRV